MTATDTPTPPGAGSPPPEPAPPTLTIPGGIGVSIPDSVDLLPGGVIKIIAENETRTLRRPSMDEFKELREARETVVRMEVQRRKDNEDPETGLPKDGLAVDMTEEIEQWVSYAISLLAPEGSLPAGKIPPWLSNGTLINDFLAHWREVPYRNK